MELFVILVIKFICYTYSNVILIILVMEIDLYTYLQVILVMLVILPLNPSQPGRARSGWDGFGRQIIKITKNTNVKALLNKQISDIVQCTYPS